jgi:hypothetical protein
MDLRHRTLDATADLEIGGPCIARVYPALHAHFRRAALPRFARAPLDFTERQIVWLAAQIFGGLAFRKGAEAAAIRADVRVIDIAIDDVADYIAVRLCPELVCGGADGQKVPPARLEQSHDLGFAQRLTVFRSGENRIEAAARARLHCVRKVHHRWIGFEAR